MQDVKGLKLHLIFSCFRESMPGIFKHTDAVELGANVMIDDDLVEVTWSW